MTSSPASRYSPHPIGVIPSSLVRTTGMSGPNDQQQQHQQQQSHVVHGLAPSMAMETPDLSNAHHSVHQRQHRGTIADGQTGSGSMLSPAGQPTGGGMTQPLHQAQGQGQDPLQSIVQQLLYLQHLDYILGQRGHM